MSDPTLADQVAAWLATPLRHPVIRRPMISKGFPEFRKAYVGAAAKVLSVLQRASRFVLEDSFVDAAVEISSGHLNTPQRIEETMRLARLPFPNVWIEWDAGRRARKQRAMGTMQGDPRDDARGQAGFLLSQEAQDPRRYSCSYFGILEPEDSAAPGGVVYLVDIEPDSREALQSWAGRPLQTFGILAGTGTPLDETWVRCTPYGTFRNDSPREPLASEYMINASNVTCDPFIDVFRQNQHLPLFDLKKLAQAWGTELWEGRGDLRFLVSVLAMIDEVPVRIGAPQQRHGTYIASGRVRTYMKHQVVTLVYPAQVAVKKIIRDLRGAASAKRRHEVRGHYRILQRQDGPLRVWVSWHMRGDATKGFVTHSYDVEAGGNPPVPRESDAPVKETI